jgi:hypothetical protein
MTSIHVGLPSMVGNLSRFAKKFDLLELRPVEKSLPKGAKLEAMRKAVPPSFVFSVVLPKSVSLLRPTETFEQHLSEALTVVNTLQARCIVIQTPSEITPSALNKQRLAQLIHKLPQDACMIAWEPRSVWEHEESAALAKSLGIGLVVDPTQNEVPPGPVMYARLRGIGIHSQLGTSAIEQVRETFVERREVFVVVETSSPKRVCDALRQPVSSSRISLGSLRNNIPLNAEDEEQ